MIRVNFTTLNRLIAVALLSAVVFACSGPDSSDSETATSATEGGAIVSPDAETATATSPSMPAGSSDTTPVSADPMITPSASPTDTMTVPAQTETVPAPTETVPASTETATTAPSPTTPVDMTGALLPDKRIVSYYGHPNSTAMGILGEYEMAEVHRLLAEQGAAYEAADPTRPVVLAFELIATVAQPVPGPDGTYVAYTGDEIIQEYVDYVTANNMILILDLQIGHDSIVNQINLIRHWLELPNVHVALDPEFSMKANETVPRDRIPGEFIGEVNGHHVQEGMELLAQIAAEAGIPPKVLIVHQFEQEMIYNRDAITPIPGVQFVLDMDGFGGGEAKIGNYGHFVRDQPIEYGGIKLFYKQDDPLLTPEEIVALEPDPLVVIYQ